MSQTQIATDSTSFPAAVVPMGPTDPLVTEMVTSFPESAVPMGPSDSLFAVLWAYEADKTDKKVNLGVGAYRDDNLRPWVLPSIKKAKARLRPEDIIEEEPPSYGVASFITASAELLFGEGEGSVLREGRVASTQTLAGSGAVHSGAMLLANPLFPTGTAESHVLIPEPTWPPHLNIFSRTTPPPRLHLFKYYDVPSKSLELANILHTLETSPERSVVVLQACGHNPTGRDPDEAEWKQIAEVMQRRHHFPFFDCAYAGLISGDPERDVWPIHYFTAELGLEAVVAQSYSKNMGMYAEHVGCLHYIAARPSPGTTGSSSSLELVQAARRLLPLQNQADYSSPPSYGARLASTILHDAQLTREWRADMAVMAERLSGTRRAIKAALDARGTPGDWTHLTRECGMFVMTGLDEAAVNWIREERHVYMAMTGRISILGLNRGNMAFFVDSLDEAVRRMRAAKESGALLATGKYGDLASSEGNP